MAKVDRIPERPSNLELHRRHRKWWISHIYIMGYIPHTGRLQYCHYLLPNWDPKTYEMVLGQFFKTQKA
jgi:hypothetical protein